MSFSTGFKPMVEIKWHQFLNDMDNNICILGYMEEVVLYGRPAVAGFWVDDGWEDITDAVAPKNNLCDMQRLVVWSEAPDPEPRLLRKQRKCKTQTSLSM